MNTISLSLNRVKYLFIEYLITYWKRDLIIFGALFLVKTICKYKHIPIPVDEFIVIIMSVILCGTFNYLSQNPKGMSYLLCPASTVEKVVIRILLVNIYYSSILILPCMLGNFTLNMLNHTQNSLIFLSQISSFRFPGVILMSQSIFIFASIYLRKQAVLKTSLLLGTLTFIMFLVIKDMSYSIENKIWHFLFWDMVNVLFTYGGCLILVFLFWFMSYLGLRETEV